MEGQQAGTYNFDVPCQKLFNYADTEAFVCFF